MFPVSPKTWGFSQETILLGVVFHVCAPPPRSEASPARCLCSLDNLWSLPSGWFLCLVCRWVGVGARHDLRSVHVIRQTPPPQNILAVLSLKFLNQLSIHHLRWSLIHQTQAKLWVVDRSGWVLTMRCVVCTCIRRARSQSRNKQRRPALWTSTETKVT